MDRLRLWIESSKQYNNDNDAIDGPYITTTTVTTNTPYTNAFFKQQQHNQRRVKPLPPPVRTCNTYDDDEVFTNVSLNLLSRQKYGTGLSPIDAVLSTLISPQQRISYYEGLVSRLDRIMHLSSSLVSIVQSIETTFGTDLRSIIEKEGCNNIFVNSTINAINAAAGNSSSITKAATNTGYVPALPLFQTLPPIAPRHVLLSSSDETISSSGGTAVSDLSIAPSTSSISRCSRASNNSNINTTGSSDTYKIIKQQRKKRRRFFPDTNSVKSENNNNNKGAKTTTTTSKIISTSSSLSSSSSFFRNKAKVQNIDWKLVQAIQQVETLRLDGPVHSDDDVHTATSSTNSSNSSTCSNRCVNHNDQNRNVNTSTCADGAGYQPPSYYPNQNQH